MPFNVIIDFEIGVTWIDLYDRTNKMSKSSSRFIKALRWILRLVAFIMSFGFILFVAFGGMMNLLVSALAPSIVGLFFVAIAGYLITKTLCPSKADTANPNWKVAAAIRRGVKHTIGSKVSFYITISAHLEPHLSPPTLTQRTDYRGCGSIRHGR